MLVSYHKGKNWPIVSTIFGNHEIGLYLYIKIESLYICTGWVPLMMNLLSSYYARRVS